MKQVFGIKVGQKVIDFHLIRHRTRHHSYIRNRYLPPSDLKNTLACKLHQSKVGKVGKLYDKVRQAKVR